MSENDWSPYGPDGISLHINDWLSIEIAKATKGNSYTVYVLGSLIGTAPDENAAKDKALRYARALCEDVLSYLDRRAPFDPRKDTDND